MASIGLMLILQITRTKLKNDRSLLFSIKENKQIIFTLFILALLMVLVLKIWGLRQESLGVPKHIQTISGIAKSLFSDKKVLTDDKEIEVKKRFWEVVSYQQLHKEKISLNYNEFSYGTMSKYKSVIKLSTIGSFLFFIFIFIVSYFSIYGRHKKMEIGIIGSYMLLITIIYLFILYFSFLVAFGNDALRIPSYVRYINIAILPLLFIGFTFLLPLFQSKEYFQKKSKNKIKLFLASLGVTVLFIFVTKPYLKPLYSQLENRFRGNIDKATKNILKVVPPKSTLFVVFPVKNNGSLNNILKYSLIPVRATISRNSFSQKTSKEMREKFIKYEYVWFASFNKELVSKDKSFLRSKSKKNIYTLYKIEKENNKISFKPIQ